VESFGADSVFPALATFASRAGLPDSFRAGAWNTGTGTTPFLTLGVGVELSFGAGTSGAAALFLFALAALVTFAGLLSVLVSLALFFAATFLRTRLRAGAAMLCSFHVLPK
jgi:hypothetical protein